MVSSTTVISLSRNKLIKNIIKLWNDDRASSRLAKLFHFQMSMALWVVSCTSMKWDMVRLNAIGGLLELFWKYQNFFFHTRLIFQKTKNKTSRRVKWDERTYAAVDKKEKEKKKKGGRVSMVSVIPPECYSWISRVG